MPAVKTHTPELRRTLIDLAGAILAREGPAAVTVRRLAAEAGTSTTAIYSLFGDKAGLVEHMYLEGFRRLHRAVAAAGRTDDPLADARSVGRAYRRAALRSPHLYELMFGRPVPGFAPSAEARAEARGTFRPVVEAVARCADADLLRPDVSVEAIAHHLWALAHGLVQLELHRTLPLSRAEHARRYDAAIAASLEVYAARR